MNIRPLSSLGRATLNGLTAASRRLPLRPLLIFGILLHAAPILSAADLGLFESHGDVGEVAKPGAVAFDGASGSYVVAGGGENMWFTNDAFHFVWKRVTGDFALQAAVEWLGDGGNAHRKACLLVRQTLRPDSPYVDIAIHGDGLTSLQFREVAGGPTREIQANRTRPGRARLERQGEVFFMSLAADREDLQPAGAFIRLRFTDPVYVGLGVCAHDNKALEKARFTRVELSPRKLKPGAKPVLHSTLEIVPIGSKDRRAVYHTLDHIEAPNWSRDGRLIFNSRGRLYRLPVAGGKPEVIDTGFANRCNNDHGISPDATRLVISDQSQTGKSLIYTLPITGGTPKRVTELGPSYWHGWSPDGQTLVYCAERNGEYDVYSIPVQGGRETRLTTAKGLDDGPEYTADGKFIYFNSDRTGTMQIWRMKPDGSDQEQVTSDEYNNWFAHPSPDGKWIVFLSYEKGVTGHPENKPVKLRLMPQGGGPIQDLVRLFGGQGTINVPSWSPDSRQVAFVSYELITPAE
jgi:regulation of enolase protein 1 (concanavalin A-like superfamily)